VSSEAYRRAGVDTAEAARAVELIGAIASGARRDEVLEGPGGFAGLFRISEDRLLAAATDGVGTKLEIARRTGRLDTVGIDLVAMCADDVACTGAEPLFFLDYIAVGRVRAESIEAIVGGVAEGCRRAGCALLGGETAEHPGVMPDDAFDLAGFCVGALDQGDLLGPHRVNDGDVLIGLSSSGLHANGYSLVREAIEGLDLNEIPDGLERPLAEELLEPCSIYAPDLIALARRGAVGGAAHITGGGFPENIPRVLPQGLGAEIDRGSWAEPAIFALLQRRVGATDQDMFATFNMGVGMVLVVPPARADEVIAAGAPAAGAMATRIGRVVGGTGVRFV
jgi:phosphoribosylformylglycinamidine cyclo-ligase